MRAVRAWLGIAGAIVVATGLTGCGSAPPPLSISCSGSTLTAPDTSDVYYGLTPSPPPVSAVPETPHPAGSVPLAALPDALDPDDLNYGYKAVRNSTISLISAEMGSVGPLWSVALRAPQGSQGSDPALNLDPHNGYAIVTGGNQGQFIAAVSSGGRAGPACILPPFTTTQRHVELLPHAGVVILANPAEPGNQQGDFWLDGYSTRTGKRLWSIEAGTSIADAGVAFIAASDTVYLWQSSDARVAAYNARTGRHLWTAGHARTQVTASDNGLLAAFGGRVYATFDNGASTQVTAMNGASGAVVWQRTVPSVATSTQIAVTEVGSGQVLLGDAGSGQELLVSAATGATLASAVGEPGAAVDNPEMQVCSLNGVPAIAIPEDGAIRLLSADRSDDRTIVIPKGQGVQVAVTGTEAYVRVPQPGAPVEGYDLATGELVWTTPAPGMPGDATMFAFAGGFVLEGQAGGTVYR